MEISRISETFNISWNFLNVNMIFAIERRGIIMFKKGDDDIKSIYLQVLRAYDTDQGEINKNNDAY